jgi:hypothetical protein
VFDLVGNVLLQVNVALVGVGVLVLVRSQVDEQELEQFGHDTEQFVVEVIVELVVELLVGGFAEGLDDVVNALPDKFFDFIVVLLVPVGGVDIGHQVNEEMRHLVDEFERLAVLQHYLLFLLFFVPLPIFFFVVLALVDLVVGVLGMLAQFDQKLCLVLEELEQL